jgi:tRNA pseudouridine55 synthase
LLDKKPGITSFEALGRVKQAFATGKVGHTGTLDKFASGLLLVLVGRAVKLASWFSGSDKQYEGTIGFGVETDTLDPEGAVVAYGEIPSREALEAALPQFRGAILQAPPAYSAIHVQGSRASQLARSGTPVVPPKRSVSVYALELLCYEAPYGSGCSRAYIRVHCSKGTYIRALARDIALAVGSRAHLVSLRRTRIGGLPVAEAVDPGDAADPAQVLRESLRPIDQSILAALGLPCLVVPPEAAQQMIQGKPLAPILTHAVSAATPILPAAVRGPVGVFSTDGGLVGIITRTAEEQWSYGYVYARP